MPPRIALRARDRASSSGPARESPRSSRRRSACRTRRGCAARGPRSTRGKGAPGPRRRGRGRHTGSAVHGGVRGLSRRRGSRSGRSRYAPGASGPRRGRRPPPPPPRGTRRTGLDNDRRPVSDTRSQSGSSRESSTENAPTEQWSLKTFRPSSSPAHDAATSSSGWTVAPGRTSRSPDRPIHRFSGPATPAR